MSSRHDAETGWAETGRAEAGCGCVTCEFEPFVRNNYFTGKMMGASDFVAETRFHQEKLRLHQARLHGWGVVCGLEVLAHPNVDCRRRYVRVTPGSAVDCCGHDILVPEEEMLDLLGFRAVADLAKEQPPRLHALGIRVCYVECPTETVPVLYDDCGCDDDGCAPNRILESYGFDVVLDPALPCLPRAQAADLAGVLFVREAEAGLGARTPRFGVAPMVGDTVHALDAGRPQSLVTRSLATRTAGALALGADAMALAARGGFAFVATGPTTGAAAQVQTFAAGATAATASVEIPGTIAADTVALAVSSDPSRAAIAYVAASGALHAFAEDATNGLAAAATSLGTIAANLVAFAATPDGTTAYALDAAAGKLKVIALAAASTVTDAAALPATARPTALARIETGGKALLAVASRTDRTLYVLAADDLAASSGLLATIALDRAPEFVGVGPEGVVHVITEAGTALFLQAVDLAPLVAGQPAILAGERAIPGSGFRLVGLLASAGAGVVGGCGGDDVACPEIVWEQACQGCDEADCLTLATIERYRAGAEVLDAGDATLADDLAAGRARIDNRAGRTVLASTRTLQAWLECLEAKGLNGKDGKDGTDGDPGKDGIGLYPDLPKILDIGWRFGERRNLMDFVNDYIAGVGEDTDLSDRIRERVKGGEDVPPLTVYFNREMKGLTRQTLEVRIDAPMVATEGKAAAYVSAGVYFPIDLRLYGELIEIPGPVPTPHTGETAAFAVSFLPRRQFFWVYDGNDQPKPSWPYVLVYYLAAASLRAGTDLPRVSLSVKGDFVYAPEAGAYSEFGVLDGDNLGGMVGEPAPAKRQPPILGGVNPSGNLTQGGLFESWFFLTLRDGQGAGGAGELAALGEAFGAMTPQPGLDRLPTLANFTAPEALATATGVSVAVARRIAAARAERSFTDLADLGDRAGLSARDREKLDGKLLFL